MMLEEAYERFLEIGAEAPPEDDRPITDNEASTRMRIIDPMLSGVLGWPARQVEAEISAGRGRVDYLLYDHDRVCWFVIEAKKRDIELVNRSPVQPVRTLKLSGPAGAHGFVEDHR